MRFFDRFRARMLTAGVGVILAGTMTGCWDTPKRPTSMIGANTPRNNSGANSNQMTSGASSWQGGQSSGGAAPINRTTGNPQLFDQSGRPTSGGSPLGSNSTPTKPTAGNPGLLNPPADSSGLQPIATNGAKSTTGILPANYGNADAPGNTPAPLKLPLADASMPTGPAVSPIVAQPLDSKPKFRSSPSIPVDSLPAAGPSQPAKPGTLLPPVDSN